MIGYLRFVEHTVPNPFELKLSRIMDVLGADYEYEIAEMLGMQRQNIAQARLRGVIPDRWLMNLMRLYGINPLWIETGQGVKRFSNALLQNATDEYVIPNRSWSKEAMKTFKERRRSKNENV